jgi:hypothetical protein
VDYQFEMDCRHDREQFRKQDFQSNHIVYFESHSTLVRDTSLLMSLWFHIVTDLINALPGNSSVNTVRHATIEKAVFSMPAVTSRSGGWWSRDVCFLWCVLVPRLYEWQNSFGSGTSQFSVGNSQGRFVVEEENKKSACEDLTCDLKIIFAVEQWY